MSVMLVVTLVSIEETEQSSYRTACTRDKTLHLYCHQQNINTHVTIGLSHSYHLDDTTLILRDIRSNFYFIACFDEIPVFLHFLLKFLHASNADPDSG